MLHANPVLPVTGHYVGLPAITDAVSSLTGLKVFGAGILVIGVARLVIMLGLFLLFEDVSGSARVAGLAALFYPPTRTSCSSRGSTRTNPSPFRLPFWRSPR